MTDKSVITDWLKSGMTVRAVSALSGIAEHAIIALVNAEVNKPPQQEVPFVSPFAPKHNMPREQRNLEIKARYEKGVQIPEMAEDYQLDRSRIQQILDKMNADRWLHRKARERMTAAQKRPFQPLVAALRAPKPVIAFKSTTSLTDEQRLDIGQRYAANGNIRQIAADHGIAAHSVAGVANKLGYYRPGFGKGVTVMQKVAQIKQDAAPVNG